MGAAASGQRLPSLPSSLHDPSLATSHFLLRLLTALDPRLVNWALVAPLPCAGAAERTANAKYALSVARRYGVRVFLIPEDITEVNAKMLFALLAGIVQRSAAPR